MKHLRLLLCLLLTTLTACDLRDALPRSLTLSARAVVHEDLAQRTLQFTLESDTPITQAQLWFGAQGGRQPLAVSVACASHCTAQHTIETKNLSLPRDVPVLRYAWLLRGVNGETLTLAQSYTSTLVLPDTSPIKLSWDMTRTGSVALFYLPETAAARDIAFLRQAAEEARARVARALDAPLPLVSIYIVPRVFWNGGAAFGKTLFISYADRAYTGVSPVDYFAHEGAHALTSDWGNLGANALIAEGIAVYATGGHYEPDEIDASAAAIAHSELFIPLSTLRNSWSNQQHEIAYTEAASFVKFLIEQYGLDRLRQIIRRPNDWSALYGRSLFELEELWLNQLRARAMPAAKEILRRWQLKIRYYDVMRRYETLFDPDARRLPSPDVNKWDEALRQAYRAPADAVHNRVLELLLVMAIEALNAHQLDRAAQLLDVIEPALSCEWRAGTCAHGELAPVAAIVRLLKAQDEAIVNRDERALMATLDALGHPQFADAMLRQLRAQPAWLRFTQTPARLELAGDQAWLTVTQWSEPLDLTQKDLQGLGSRWIIALQKTEQGWRITGRWQEAVNCEWRRAHCGSFARR
jgi:hypothetical protein